MIKKATNLQIVNGGQTTAVLFEAKKSGIDLNNVYVLYKLTVIPETGDLPDEVFDKIGVLATKEHRSITNYIEYVLLKHLEEVEREQGEIDLDDPEGD